MHDNINCNVLKAAASFASS